MDPVAFARGLIDIDSTTGREGEAARWLAQQLRALGFTVTEQQVDGDRANVIATLGDSPGLTCTELSEATLVTKGTLTGVLDRLEAKHLIRRDAVSEDRRRVKIRLTETGQALFEKVFPAHAAFLRPYFETALTQREADQLRALLLRVRDSFQKTSG